MKEINEIMITKGTITEIFFKAKQKGFFHIIFSSTLVKIIGFLSAIFLPRFLSKYDYGLLSYIDTIRNYILLFNGLGIANATLRYCAQDINAEKKKGLFLATIIIGVSSDVLLIIGSIVIFMLVPFQFEGSKYFLLLSSVFPIFAFLYEDMQLFLRACFENKKYSIVSFVYAFLMVVLQIIFAIWGQLKGIILGRYIAIVISLFITWIFVKNLKAYKVKTKYLEKREIIYLFKFGIVMMFTGMSSLIIQLNETFIISIVLKDAEILADYRIATYILQISLFFFQAMLIFILPYFVNHAKDKKWVWSNFKKISLVNTIIMIPLHILLIIFTKPILFFLFGEKYLSAANIMQILLIASLCQAIFRGIPGNILGGIGEENFNLKVNIIFVIVHFVVDFWAVSTFGIMGAACALIITYFFSGIIITFHLYKVCHNV